jgi:hypothetical protein
MATDEAYQEVLRRLDERQGAPMAEEKGELDATIAGQKLSLRNVSLNTLATVLTLLIVILIAYVLYTHQQDAKEASAGFVTAIKEQTIVQREQTVVMREANCLQGYQGPPDGKASFCKTISR